VTGDETTVEVVDVAGVDGCRGGWVVVSATTAGAVAGATARVEFVDRLDAMVHRPLSVIGVDMPIGLSDQVRACDRAARRLLGRRACCVFSAPPRDCLHADDYADATRRAVLARGQGLTRQAFHLLAKIAEVDRLARGPGRARLVEVHPEVCFARLAGHPLATPKRTSQGQTDRLALLEPHFPDVARHLVARPRGVTADDLLDAFAVTWTARRVVAGTAERLGDGSTDAHGLPMEIVC
jgi:predicted RNase H-like nuclease